MLTMTPSEIETMLALFAIAVALPALVAAIVLAAAQIMDWRERRL